MRSILLCLLLAGSAAAEPAWRYEVQVGEGARELAVEARFSAGAPEELSVDGGAEPFVRAVELEEGGAWRPLPASGTSWIAPSCRARGCHLRYRFELRRAADALHGDVAGRAGEAIQAPPATFLIHPIGADAGSRYRFHVIAPAPTRFVTGVNRVAGLDDTYEADVGDLVDGPWSLFGPLRVETRVVRGATLEIAFAPAKRRLSDAELLAFIEGAADAVGRYFGKFPVERVAILVLPFDRQEPFGRAIGGGGASILIYIGPRTGPPELATDWVLVHEMTHLGFPSVPRPEAAWIEEGLATWLEPIIRARAGKLSAEQVWGDLVHGLPKGQPEPGDGGLDVTHTWGRTYWGGAGFALLAEIRIRERTGGKKSLDDALRGILAAGGNVEAHWSLARALAEGDRATGVPVLTELHAQLGPKPFTIDLPDLWRRLGVSVHGRRIQFDDTAPLAKVRRALASDGDGVPRFRIRSPTP